MADNSNTQTPETTPSNAPAPAPSTSTFDPNNPPLIPEGDLDW